MKLREEPPKTIAELRSLKFPPFPLVTDFTVRHWITSSFNYLNEGNKKWLEWKLEPNSDGIKSNKIEEAFLDIRRAALIAQHMRKHPQFEILKKNQAPEYYSALDLTGKLNEGVRTNGEIAVACEKREQAWALLKEAAAVASSSTTSKSESNSKGLEVARGSVDSNYSDTNTRSSRFNSEDSVGALIDGYSSHSPIPSLPNSTVPAVSLPLSMEQRMAALRSKGVDTEPLKPTIRSPAPPLVPPIASTSKSAPTPSLIPLTTLIPDKLVPPKPLRKPEGLGLRNTPPSSPRSPIVKNGSNMNSSSVVGGSMGAFGWEESTTAPTARSPVSPTSFGGQFPSLDELETRFSSNNPYSSPPLRPTVSASSPIPIILSSPNEILVPTTKKVGRPPLPPTPRGGWEMNEAGVAEAERNSDEARSQAMSKLNGSNSSNRSALVPSPVPSSDGTRTHYQHPPPQSQQQQRPVSSYSPSYIPLPLPSSSSPTMTSSSSTTSKTAAFINSYSNEILPLELYTILVDALNRSDGPRILLLDVREREDYERERIMGESVCLEPFILRNGVSSTDLESSLSVSPSSESNLFNSRNLYDRVVIYDLSSTSLPNVLPPSTSSKSQKDLYNLTSAIYEREFRKSLKKQPVLLVGGFEGWKQYVGSKGIVKFNVAPSHMSNGGGGGGGNDRETVRDEIRRSGVDEMGRAEAKKANRQTTIMSPDCMRSGPNGIVNGVGMYSPSSNSQSTNNQAYASSNYYPIGTGAVLNSSHEVALPPTAIQRSGGGGPQPITNYDPYAYSSNNTRPSYTQPNINNFGAYPGPTTLPNSPSMGSLNSSTGMRNDGGSYDPHSGTGGGGGGGMSGSNGMNQTQYQQQQQQSFTNYSNAPRPSIDYPSLRPAVNQTLTRPPPVQPAPLRSNSSFSGVSLPLSYPSSSLGSPSTSFGVANLQFGEETIGLTGLKNLGNTCYMNSTIQCLSATISFARYFREGGYKADINTFNPLGTKGALASAVAELIRAIWAQQYTSLSPITFRDNICRWAPQFRGTDQHDAQEFLGFLLDGLHEDLNYVRQKPLPIEMTPEREHDLETLPPQIMSQREWDIYTKRNDSFVVRSFQGQFRNQMKCLTCSKTSTTYNTFMSLSVPIPVSRNKVPLEECIATFVREEILDKDEAWFCPRCKCPRKASKKLSLSRLPPILLIHFKRFSFKGPFSDKIETQVTYPLSGLDLTGFVPPPLFDPRAPPLTTSAKGQVYDLYGVTNHYGTLSSGHYTAYVRDHKDWHNIGDSKVTRVNPEVVQSARSAYILFYRLR